MERSNVFHFDHANDFIRAAFAEIQSRNPQFSVRSLSRQLGSVSPGSISRILRDERTPTPAILERLARFFGLEGTQKQYFELINLLARAKSSGEKALIADMIKKIPGRSEHSVLSVDRFQLITEWYHIPIMELTELKEFNPDPNWIAQQLHSKITSVVAQAALERLIRLELLERNPQTGRYQKTQKGYFKVGDESTDLHIRDYHRKQLENSIASIDQFGTSERELQAISLTLDQESFSKAKVILRSACQEIAELVPSGQGKQVFQLNCQLFPVSKKIAN